MHGRLMSNGNTWRSVLGAKSPTLPRKGGRMRGGGGGGAAGMVCIVEVAARRWLAGCSEQERGWVPRRELKSWVCLMHEVELLRLPVVFGRAHAD